MHVYCVEMNSYHENDDDEERERYDDVNDVVERFPSEVEGEFDLSIEHTVVLVVRQVPLDIRANYVPDICQ